MKNPKKPTRAQKTIMQSAGLAATKYLVINETEDSLKVICKEDNTIKVLEKQKETIKPKGRKK